MYLSGHSRTRVPKDSRQSTVECVDAIVAMQWRGAARSGAISYRYSVQVTDALPIATPIDYANSLPVPIVTCTCTNCYANRDLYQSTPPASTPQNTIRAVLSSRSEASRRYTAAKSSRPRAGTAVGVRRAVGSAGRVEVATCVGRWGFRPVKRVMSKSGASPSCCVQSILQKSLQGLHADSMDSFSPSARSVYCICSR
mgnify:CR=1 FL=1|jgi:hypothetical protein